MQSLPNLVFILVFNIINSQFQPFRIQRGVYDRRIHDRLWYASFIIFTDLVIKADENSEVRVKLESWNDDPKQVWDFIAVGQQTINCEEKITFPLTTEIWWLSSADKKIVYTVVRRNVKIHSIHNIYFYTLIKLILK